MVCRRVINTILLLALALTVTLSGCAGTKTTATPLKTTATVPSPVPSPELTTPATTAPSTTMPAVTTTPPTTTVTTTPPPTTSIPGVVNILSNSSYIRHGKWTQLGSGKTYEGDFLHIVGELSNDGQVNVKSFSMDATYYDSGGTALTITGRTYLDESPSVLMPGEKSPFLFILFDEETSQQTASYQLSVSFITTNDQPYALNIMSDRSYMDRWSGYKVLGEVENTGESTVESVKVLATFYDENEKVIDMDYTYANLNMILPGQKAPFSLLPNRGADVKNYIKSYSLRVECRITDREVYREFQILNETSGIGTIDEYVVEGQIKNVGDKDVTFVKILATFYRADGTIAAFGYTYTDPIDLKAGETGQFRVTSYPYEVAAGEVVRYSLEFECSNY